MVMKLISLSHKNFSRAKKPYLQWRNLSYATNQSYLPPLQLDHSMDSIRSISTNPAFALLGLCRNSDSLRTIHCLFIASGLTGDLLCDTKLISLYGSFGNMRYARLLFDRMRERDFYSWKVMIRWYFLNDLHKDIIHFYTRMRMWVKEHDNVVFSIVVKACTELNNIYEGRKVHCLIAKAGNPDSFVLTGLVDMYAKCGEIESSRKVFDEIFDRSVVTWTSMIVGYVQNDCSQEGLILFNQMRERFVKSNQFTLASLVKGCTNLGALHQGKWVHGYAIKNGTELNSCLVTALLDMYVKCGDIRDGRSIFDEQSSTELVSWTAMIVGYTQRGFPDEALKLFMDKKWVDILPNAVTLASVISACGQVGNLKLGRSTHGLEIKLGLEDSTVISALVHMYAKCKMIADARYLFETVSDRDVNTWNSIISGYSQNGSAREALELFSQMRWASCSPDDITLVSVLSACAFLGALGFGSSLHACSIKEGSLSSNVYVGTALLNFYAKSGDAKSARSVFDSMRAKNTITWSAMIGGYGIQGDGCGSIALFSDMLKEELEPSEVIFTTLLSACSHTGMVGEGWRCFNSMCQDYHFVPSTKHYACMVDLLARAGRLEEAWDFIDKMHIQPNVSVFGAFLHGCGLHSRFDLGAMAIRRMLELNPDKASYYVLISNLYASDGRWSQVNHVRKLMKQRGLNKSPGSSLLDMDIGKDFSFAKVASFA